MFIRTSQLEKILDDITQTTGHWYGQFDTMLTQKLTLNTPPRVDSKAELLEAKDVGIGRYYPLHFKSW